MKTRRNHLIVLISIAIVLGSCGGGNREANSPMEVVPPAGGQSTVQDNESAKDIVHVAMGSPDHGTLVTALKAAAYVDVLANAGPFTVFAPTNAAFDELPAGTVESLLEPEKKDDLRNILEYHVVVGVYKLENLKDQQKINTVNLDDVVVGKIADQFTINGAKILGTVRASNGVVYVIDKVLLPPAKE